MTDTATTSDSEPSNDLPPDAGFPEPEAVQTDPGQPATVLAEPQPDPLPDDVTDPTGPVAAAAPAPARRKSGSTVVGILIGAAIAAGAGYGVQRYLPQQAAFDPAALEARLTAAEAEAQTLRADLTRLSDTAQITPPPAPAADPALLDRIAALEAAQMPDLAPLAARLDGVEANLAALANLPSETGVSPAALAAMQAEVAALKSQDSGMSGELTTLVADVEGRLTEAEARAAELTAQATAIAAAATRTAALAQIGAALDSGLPYSAALTALGGEALPEVLSANADTGLPSVATLRAAFPEAARLALEQALRANPGTSWTDRVGTFLRNQTGARSLAPRDGTDPDAILSRAEAALARADVPAALTEVAALPPESQAALAGWMALAQQRLDAQAALAGLLQGAGQ